MKSRILIALGVVIVALLLLVIVEFLLIKFGGTAVAAPDIPRAPETYGSGPAATYVVLGDSTSISQGGDYDKGIARATARHIGQTHTVTLHNLGVSGARAADVATKQLPAALVLRPDIVLIDIGANDVTGLTSTSSMRTSLTHTVDSLRAANPAVHIVITGAPQMGSVPRLPQPVRYAARLRTGQINRMVVALAAQRHITFAPIADETGSIFAAHHELFAPDNFHPTTAGYLFWIPVLNQAFNQALSR